MLKPVMLNIVPPETDKAVRWAYSAGRVDLEVWCETRERAAEIMQRNGYNVDPAKLVNHGNGIKVQG